MFLFFQFYSLAVRDISEGLWHPFWGLTLSLFETISSFLINRWFPVSQGQLQSFNLFNVFHLQSVHNCTRRDLKHSLFFYMGTFALLFVAAVFWTIRQCLIWSWYHHASPGNDLVRLSRFSNEIYVHQQNLFSRKKILPFFYFYHVISFWRANAVHFGTSK